MRVTLDRGARWARIADVRYLITSPDTRHQAESVEIPANSPMTFGASHILPRPLRRRLPKTLGCYTAVFASVLRGLSLARKADVIVAGREIGNGLLAARALARITGRPLAVTVQSNIGTAIEAYTPPGLREPTKHVYKHVDLAVCVSAGLTPSVEAVGVPPSRIKVVHNGLDSAHIQALAKQPPSIPLPVGKIVVLSGRLSYQKGFDIAIRAHAAALAAGAPRHTLLILGEGDARGELQALATKLNVSDSVMLPGFIGNPHAIVARADVFLMTSRWEGFSLVLAEALAVGTPIIATDCVSGPSEILEQGQYGDLFAVEDVKGMSQSLTKHLNDPNRLRLKAAAGRTSVLLRFNSDNAANQHLVLLNEIKSINKIGV